MRFLSRFRRWLAERFRSDMPGVSNPDAKLSVGTQRKLLRSGLNVKPRSALE